MKTYKYIIGFLAICFVWSCSEDKIMTFGGKGHIYFKKQNDTTRFSFAAYDSDVSEAYATVVVRLAGSVEDYDRKINYRVSDDAKDPDTKYEIVTPAILEAMQDSAYLQIKIYKTENLNHKRDTLSIELIPTEDLKLGYEGSLVHTFILYGKYDKPTWWDRTIDWQIGYFSEEKYRIMIEVAGSQENLDPTANTQWVYQKYLFRKYIEEHKPTYDDGTPITFNDSSY